MIKLIMPTAHLKKLSVHTCGCNGLFVERFKAGKNNFSDGGSHVGGAPMSPFIASKSLQLIRGKKTETVSPEENKYNLTKRELYSKLQVHNKVEATKIAVEMKII